MGSSNTSQDESLQSYNKSSSPGENIEILDEHCSMVSYDENVGDENEEISLTHTFESHQSNRTNLVKTTNQPPMEDWMYKTFDNFKANDQPNKGTTKNGLVSALFQPLLQ